jgi:adenylylsulfate kinase
MRVLKSRNHFSDADRRFLASMRFAGSRSAGSVGIKLTEIASGRADLYFNFDGLSAWDIAGPQAILEEAGGAVSDCDGSPLHYSPRTLRFSNGIVAVNRRNPALASAVRRFFRAEKIRRRRGTLVWITGLAGSGKTTIAKKVVAALAKAARGRDAVLVDGDQVRRLYGNDVGYGRKHRLLNAWRVARLCSSHTAKGRDVVCATISLFHEIHAYNRRMNPKYVEVLLRVDGQELRRRNKKGLYSRKRARVVGVSVRPEFPKAPHLRLKNNNPDDIQANVRRILSVIPHG